MNILGVDTGGTFTDFVYFSSSAEGGGELRLHKVLSTPHAPEEAILRGIAEMGLETRGLLLVHGSTVATNAVLEGKGVRCAYVSNRGFADVLTIGRQARRELYNVMPEPESPPVPRELCFEVGGRLSARGETLEPLTDADLMELKAAIEAARVDAVAINLLYSYLDDHAEKRIAAAMPEGVFVSRSSAVLAEYKEYERGMATWFNAYVGPLMQGYLGRLCAALPEANVMVMQSHGGAVTAEKAGKQAVELLLSGPAGGLVGAKYQGAASGVARLMTFDMGGTSSDVALIDGDIQLSSDSEIAGYPVAVSMVDMHTIGAGGGSIAWLDEGGMLQVGPESAGAMPGPACYGQGGERATVTDANVVLGRLPVSVSLGGSLRLDRALAERAVKGIADALGMSVAEAAEGILAIANEHMAQALRVISVQKGHDPADFTLMSFGGAGGLHVCALADLLGMSKALVPAHGGVLSALGMVVAPVARMRSQTWIVLLDELEGSALQSRFESLGNALEAELRGEGVEQCALEYAAELRYQGQSSTLRVPWEGDVAALREGFHRLHREQFGHALSMNVELVTLRARAQASVAAVHLPPCEVVEPAEAEAQVEVVGEEGRVPFYRRERLAVGQTIVGPAVIGEKVSTTWLAAGWLARNDAAGNLLLEKQVAS